MCVIIIVMKMRRKKKLFKEEINIFITIEYTLGKKNNFLIFILC